MYKSNFFKVDFSDFINVWNELEKELSKDLIGETETNNERLIEIVAPGLIKDSIKIKLCNNYIDIRAKTKKNIDYARRFYVGPKGRDNIKAKYEDGIIIITIPKKEEAPTLEIKIE